MKKENKAAIEFIVLFIIVLVFGIILTHQNNRIKELEKEHKAKIVVVDAFSGQPQVLRWIAVRTKNGLEIHKVREFLGLIQFRQETAKQK